MTKISIVVPVYNVEKYLEKCIESILDQIFKDYELILVNDGSTDSSFSICQQYLNKDSRIKVINKQNGGLSSARNIGIDKSSGEYIFFVDSDDWIHPYLLQELYKSALYYKADIVQCNFTRTYDEDFHSKPTKEVNPLVLTNIEALEYMYNKMPVEMVVTWNKLYKRNLFDEIRFPIGKIHEDEFTTYKLFYLANKVVHLNQAFYYYRDTPNSIMNTPFNFKRLHRLEALQERALFYKNIKNKKLYNLNTRKYIYLVKKYYYNYEKCDIVDKILLNKIRKDSLPFLIDYLKSNKKDLIGNLSNFTFYYSPLVYKKIKRGKNI